MDKINIVINVGYDNGFDFVLSDNSGDYNTTSSVFEFKTEYDTFSFSKALTLSNNIVSLDLTPMETRQFPKGSIPYEIQETIGGKQYPVCGGRVVIIGGVNND